MNYRSRLGLVAATVVVNMVAMAQDVVWKKNFGGSDQDGYNSVTTVSDGIIAVGYSYKGSFGNGDWGEVTGKGGDDAIIVKYDNEGNVVWKKNFGGNEYDRYSSVTTVSDGIIAVGCSYPGSFGNGDWGGVTGKGSSDAIIVKYDNTGNVVWKKNFGGNNIDEYYSVTTVSDGIIAVGDAYPGSGSGDWGGVTGKGGSDAVIVKYTSTTTGIAGANHYSPLRVYPNPTTGQLIIDNGQLTMENVEIYDVVGQKIVNYQLSTVNSIDISKLSAGLYFLKIGNRTTRFMKE
jgi:hypothetical protein